MKLITFKGSLKLNNLNIAIRMIRADVRYDSKEMESVKLDVGFDILPRLGEIIHIEKQTYIIRKIIHFPADLDRNVELYVDDESP